MDKPFFSSIRFYGMVLIQYAIHQHLGIYDLYKNLKNAQLLKIRFFDYVIKNFDRVLQHTSPLPPLARFYPCLMFD